MKVRGALGIPDRMITKLEYRTSHDFVSTFGTADILDYRLNSVYDPESATGGGQPLWTDEMATLYNKYRVFNCRYEIKMVAINSNGTPIRVVTLATASPGVLPSDIATAWEQNRSASRLVPPGADTITTLRGNISLPKLQGQTSVAFKGDDKNYALLTANPVNPATLRFIGASVNGSAELVQYTMDIKLTYSVEFYDRKIPARS